MAPGEVPMPMYSSLTLESFERGKLNSRCFHWFPAAMLGPDYMSRAGPVSRDDVGLPGSRHFC